MTIVYPLALDSFTNPQPTDQVSVVDHSWQHSDANDAITALEVKVWVDNSTDPSSLDFRVSSIEDGLPTWEIVWTTDVQSLTNKTVNGVNLQDSLPATVYLDGTGNYTTPTWWWGWDMNTAVYDPANVAEQLVGLTAPQVMTNKTINGVTLTNSWSATNFLNEQWNYVAPAWGWDMSTAVYDPANVSEQLVGLTASQTISNKTLTLPSISTILNIWTLVLPTTNDTLVGRNTTDTLTNKTISWSTNTLSNISTTSLSDRTWLDSSVVTWTAWVSWNISSWNIDWDIVDSWIATSDVVTPINNKPIESFVVSISDETTDLTTGTAKTTFRMPYAFTVTEVRASVTTAPTWSVATFDINENGVSILSTLITIDAWENTSTTAAIPPVISNSSLGDDSEITLDIDTIGSTVSWTWAKIYIIGNRT